MINRKFDVAIIVRGILGIAHAFACLRKGLKVVLFEQNKRQEGASVRNFGQIVPSRFASNWL